MPDDPRVQQLLDEMLESGATPEQVCGSCIELLPVVQDRWRQMCQTRAELDAIFPPRLDPGEGPPAPLPAAPLPAVPGYEIEAVLGVGGMGVVFRARHLRLNRPVALKMALAGAYAGARERERFQREAEAVAALRHPNVVQVYDVGDSDGRPYFTMELVDGGSLAQKLAGVPLPCRDAAALVAALASAVHAAHGAGIVHRDLKPANVLLAGDGTPKVSDFGLARRLDSGSDLTRTGTALGTPSYMAPEQARGEAAVGPGVDVYALGAILYELLTGRPPFRAGTGAETLRQLSTQDPVPPSRLNSVVPRDLETICLKCLHKDPRLRYATAAALAEDVHRFLRGESILARPEDRLTRLARRVRQRPITAAALATGTLLLIVLIGGVLRLVSERSATEHAAQEDLREMAERQGASAWPEANAALQRARGRLGSGGSAELRRRLDQGARELELVARLDTIRLNRVDKIGVELSFVVANDQADEAYANQFRASGFGGDHDAPEDVASRIRTSNVRDVLVAALDDWSVCSRAPGRKAWILEVAQKADRNPTGWRARARDSGTRKSKAALTELTQTVPVKDGSVSLLIALAQYLEESGGDSIPFLMRLQEAHPNDFWANYTLANQLRMRLQSLDALRYYQAALAIRPRTSPVHNNLGVCLTQSGRFREALPHFELALEIDPTNTSAFGNLGVIWFNQGHYDKAISRLQESLSRDTGYPVFHWVLGSCFEAKAKFDDALDQYRQALALDPKLLGAQNHLHRLLMRLDRAEELWVTWGRRLEADPSDHAAWFGYAELSLFLGREDEYRRVRRVMLAKFGATTDPNIAERTSRMCLLLPATAGEVDRAAALAAVAVKAGRTTHESSANYFLFSQGLLDYRQGRFDEAISVMRGNASEVLGPAPRLVRAMALHRSNKPTEAKKMFASAVLSYDWRANQMRDHDDCICHVLRREAERMMIPNLPAFLAGNYEPESNDEWMALLGVCQFENRSADMIRIYQKLFASSPLADNIRLPHCYNAVRAAAQLGCGLASGTTQQGDQLRGRWRIQLRKWLRADLLALSDVKTSDPIRVCQTLAQWRAEPDLAYLRDSAELEKLPADERKEWFALWADVGALQAQLGNKK